MLNGLVYCYTHNDSGRHYVGQSTSKFLNRRVWAHKHMKSGCQHFNDAVQKYGYDAFTFRILEDEIPTAEQLDAMETYWIKELNSYGKGGFNMTLGGQGARGIKRSDSAKQKTSESLKRAYAEGRKEKKHTAHTKALISARQFNPVSCWELGITFDTMTDAATYLGSNRHTINQAFREGAAINGVHVVTVEYSHEEDIIFPDVMPRFSNASLGKGRLGRPVVCLDTGEVFTDAKSAASWVKGRRAGLQNAIRLGSRYMDYSFKYADSDQHDYRQ